MVFYQPQPYSTNNFDDFDPPTHTIIQHPQISMHVCEKMRYGVSKDYI